MAKTRACWLMKTEPDAFSIDDLKRLGTSPWDGVRNYLARNYMRDSMSPGDRVLFYHSRSEPMGIVGLAKVAKAAHPDLSALDPKSKYFDPKATEEKPIWMMVDVEFVEKWARCVTLAELKAHPVLSAMMVCQRGSRLSIQPVEPAHYDLVCKLGRKNGP